MTTTVASPTITMTFEPLVWECLVNILKRAIAFRFMPEGWRRSEYVMTKTHANQLIGLMEEQLRIGQAVILTYFDWSLLSGEIARLYQKPEEDHEQILQAFTLINTEMRTNIGYSKLLQAIEDQGKAAQKLEEHKLGIEQAKHDLWESTQRAVNLSRSS